METQVTREEKNSVRGPGWPHWLRDRRILIPFGVSLLSGAVVALQVSWAQRVPIVQPGVRLLVAERTIREGERLHPHAFTFRFVASHEIPPGVIDDQRAHFIWGRPALRTVAEGEWLTVDAVGEETPERSPRQAARGRPKKQIEILKDEGE